MSFYWAWTDSSETTFGPSHEVYDENVFAFTIEHREGECATLTLTIRNPRVGLLSAGRQVWGWLSWNDGTATTPLFFGRLIGIPDMQGSASGFAETMDLVFVAKPVDFASQRRDLANSLAILPHYDRIFISDDLRLDAGSGTGDVNTALEARSARWHCSRGEDGLPLVVSISDINIGEDGDEIFESSTGSPACIDPASISLSISGTPLVSVTVKASVPWKQDMTDAPAINLGTFIIESWGASLVNAWPKVGSSIGGGWAAAQGTFAIDQFFVEQVTTSNYHLNWQNKSKSHTTGDSMSLNIQKTDVVVHGPYISVLLTRNLQAGVVWASGDFGQAMGAGTLPTSSTTGWSQFAFDDQIAQEDGESDVINVPLHHDASWGVVPKARTIGSLAITFDAGADRTENCNFTMIADVQPVLTDPNDFDTAGDATPPDEVILELPGADPTACIDGETALADPSMSSYFHTERGKQSVEYLLLRARALLMAGARIVNVSFGIPFERAINLTCRKNVRLNWEKLPGGYASGKVIQYSISANEGKLQGSVTIGCTVGRNDIGTGGQVYTAVGGDGELVIPAEDALEPGIQQMIGQVIPVGGGDVAFSPALMGLDTLGNPVPISADDVLVSVNFIGSAGNQQAAITSALNTAHSIAAQQATSQALGIQQPNKENASTIASQLVAQNMVGNEVGIEFELRSTNDLKFADINFPTLEPLLIPKTIDLEDPVTT